MEKAKKIAVFHAIFHPLVKGGGEKLALQIRDHLRADLIAGSIDLKAWGKSRIQDDSFVHELWRRDLRFFYFSKESRVPYLRRLRRALSFRCGPGGKFLNHYDLVIFSGDPSGISNKVSTPRKVYYCNTPPRHLTDQKNFFLRKFPKPLRRPISLYLTLDLKRYAQNLHSMDLIITNSENTRKRLLEYTGLDSKVAFPAVETEKFRFMGQKDYYLSYARLDEWKRIDLIVRAFQKMPARRLVIASSGPLRAWVKREIAGYPNIVYEGQVSEERLAELVGYCIAGIYIPIHEDAGITPCELMAAGKPVIGVREGGLLETVVDGQTGILIPADPGARDLMEAVGIMTPEKARSMKDACQQQAGKFDKKEFFTKLESLIFDMESQGTGAHQDASH